jgi:hypothetical protein
LLLRDSDTGGTSKAATNGRCIASKIRQTAQAGRPQKGCLERQWQLIVLFCFGYSSDIWIHELGKCHVFLVADLIVVVCVTRY